MKNENNKTIKKSNKTKQTPKAKETKNLNLEIQQNLESLFREFQSSVHLDIAELKIFELKVSVLKEILKMNMEIDKKTEKAPNLKVKKITELSESSFIAAGLTEMINEALYNKILSTETDEETNLKIGNKSFEQDIKDGAKIQEDSVEIIF
jgi:hypothetical protein